MSDHYDVNRLCMGCMSKTENKEDSCPHCGWQENRQELSPHHLPPQTILNGKYLLGRVLGEGGFGITYLGWDLNLDMKVAIKEFYPAGFVTRETTTTTTVTPFSGDKREAYISGLDKFVGEAKSLAKFYSLPGIVSVKDFFKENGTAYIVMEYVDGITLKQYLQKEGGKLPVYQVLEWVKPLMISLSQMHAAGIIHRDISPDNIMITRNGDIKLLDFGAARDISIDGAKSLSVLLKPGYAPEEQYRTRGNQGPWTDVYALCATIYKAITGQTPPESMERMHEEALEPPTRLGIEINEAKEAVLLKGLAVLQKNRYQSMNELYEALMASDFIKEQIIEKKAAVITQPIASPKPDGGTNLRSEATTSASEHVAADLHSLGQNLFLTTPIAVLGIVGGVLRVLNIFFPFPRLFYSLTEVIFTLFFIGCFLQLKKWGKEKTFMLLAVIGSAKDLAIMLVTLTDSGQTLYYSSPASSILLYFMYLSLAGFSLSLLFIKTTSKPLKGVALLSAVYGVLEGAVLSWMLYRVKIGVSGGGNIALWTSLGDILFLILIIMHLVQQKGLQSKFNEQRHQPKRNPRPLGESAPVSANGLSAHGSQVGIPFLLLGITASLIYLFKEYFTGRIYWRSDGFGIVLHMVLALFLLACFLKVSQWNTAKWLMLLSFLGAVKNIIIMYAVLTPYGARGYYQSAYSEILEPVYYLFLIAFALALLSSKAISKSLKASSFLGVIYGFLYRPVALSLLKQVNYARVNIKVLTAWHLLGYAIFIILMMMLLISQITDKRKVS